MPQPEPVTLYPIFKRRCLLCRRPMNGWGFYTLYGSVEYMGKRVYGCGDPVHYRCAGHDQPRAIERTPLWFGETENTRRYTRTVKIVAPGIILQQNGRYSARWNKKRLGTHATIDEAHAARAKHQRQLRAQPKSHSPASSHPWQTKREKKEQRHERQIARR